MLDRWETSNTQVFYDCFQRKILLKQGEICRTFHVDTLQEGQQLRAPAEHLRLAVLNANETILAFASGAAVLVTRYKGVAFPA